MINLKNSTKTDWILIFVGLAITVLFIVFSTKIYEALYYESEFSNEMYNQNMYFLCAYLTAIISWVMPFLYYCLIDRFDRWWHWLIVLIITLALSPVVVYVYPEAAFDEQKLDFSTQLGNFAIANHCVTLVLFLIASFSVKNLSTHCSETPWPSIRG